MFGTYKLTFQLFVTFSNWLKVTFIVIKSYFYCEKSEKVLFTGTVIVTITVMLIPMTALALTAPAGSLVVH